MLRPYAALWCAMAFAMLLALIPHQARACSCAEPRPPQEALSNATAVFMGQVMRVNFPTSTDGSTEPVEYFFTVSEVWKGPVQRTLKVESDLFGSTCGYGFAQEEYLVYAEGAEDSLTVNLCSRTKLAANANEDLAALGEGEIPDSSRAYMPTLHGVPCEKDLIGRLEENSGFSTLIQLLEAANLTDALANAGPFTLFAPTDAAFAALPSGALEQLLANPTGQLTQILLYHLVPGEIEESDLFEGMQMTTQQGKMLVVGPSNSCGVAINSARIITPNIRANNGIIHAIDTVLLPPPD